MSKLTITPEMKELLAKLSDATEFVDERGHLVGRFLPTQALGPMWHPVSDEELERRMAANDPTYTTEEVLRYLGTLV